MNSRRIIAIIRWILSFSSLAGIVLVYRNWVHTNPATVALTLLLLILLLAAEWGLRYAVVLSLAATACYNFFFLPPVGTFTIVDAQNWLALFAFLVTAIMASRLSQRARNQTEEARSRQHELEVLFHLSHELLQTESLSSVVPSVPSAVAAVTGARAGLLYLLDGDRLYRAETDDVSEIEIPHLRNLAETLSGVRQDGEDIYVPLHTGMRPRGLLRLRGAALSAKTLEAIGGLVCMSMDRAQALENVARGEAAKESERLRTLMIDSITHELRTPLTSIKGAATALLSGNVEQESGRELLTIIDEESDRLNRLVSEAVEMAQLDAQQIQMHFAPANVLSMIKEAIESCSWVEEQHSVIISVPSTLQINADVSFLRKVICNLLENAAKYSKPETPITISAELRTDSVVVSVADRGIGIDQSEQALIFERFYRSRSHGEGMPGTGMGLPISRSIVEAHGGHMDITSQPGQGSVFSFTIPAIPSGF